MRCLIFSGYIDGIERLHIDFQSYDFLLAADAGMNTAGYFGVTPDAAIGDFDSSRRPELTDQTVLPPKKDMTDGEAALDLAVQRGADDITLLGGLGGRFDHTIGNIGVLAEYAVKGLTVRLLDGYNRVRIVTPGTYEIQKDGYHYLGFGAWGDRVTGLTIRGAAYPLENFTLTNLTSRCVSNEIPGESAEVTFDSGLLLIIQSEDASRSVPASSEH